MKLKGKYYLSLVMLLSGTMLTPIGYVFAETDPTAVSSEQQLETMKEEIQPDNVTEETENSTTESSQINEQTEVLTSTTTDSTIQELSAESTNESQENLSESVTSSNQQISTVESSNTTNTKSVGATKAVMAQFNIHVADSSTNQGVSGAYFTLTFIDSGAVNLLVTDSNGDASVSVLAGKYMIKQIGTTNAKQNYGFTSAGYAVDLQPGEVKSLSLYERNLPGAYAFGNSPDTIHIPVNSTFNFTAQALGIEAFKLNYSGNYEKSIPSSQIYPYYSNVNTSIPGSYVAIFMAQQATYNTNTTHLVNVIVEPEALGEVTVNYVDSKGQAIHSPQIINGNIGEAYDASTAKYQLTIEGYTLDTTKIPENITGNFSETSQTVNYVYTKNPVLSAGVTVNYVDPEGQAIHSPQIINGNIGEAYDASTAKYQLAIEGYTLDTTQIPENITGNFSETSQTVDYVYTKNPVLSAGVTVNYVDPEGQAIHSPQILSGNIGEAYDASTAKYQLAIEGYTLDTTQIPENITGNFSETPQTVDYVYTKNPVLSAGVTVNYVDPEGKNIHSPQILSGNIGEAYDASTAKYQLAIEGYTLDTTKIPENAIGFFGESTQTVTYSYTKILRPSKGETVIYTEPTGQKIYETSVLKEKNNEAYSHSILQILNKNIVETGYPLTELVTNKTEVATNSIKDTTGETLPKTNEKNSRLSIAFGLGLISFAGWLLLRKKS
ncbi:hypothetical protein BH747_03905 [Enterococcus villorum]|uniref:Gram-positive cocci surface proteins LPxTG domain-containing protein n=2 Tax=Enterococcus villorum TaxID=112904 RepID=A0A1V8YF17_9ENTE|nr:MucBP domain-containing protein [Enterococcus villorum]OQO71148.1 hypothetical protein BH747_03905 [Enterococcus villorum]